jgi:hypothetical protein
MRTRRSRYDLQRGLRRVTTVKRVRTCGNAIGAAVGVKYDSASGAGFTGRETCGSVWSCPVCASKVAARRAIELEALLSTAEARGKRIAMVTLTVRHHKGDTLRDVWDAVAKGWAAITRGRAWVNVQRIVGLVGWVKAVEVTVGKNGWHVHVHALMILDDVDALGLLTDHVWTAWLKGIESVGFTALRHQGGLDVAVSDGRGSALADYITKTGSAEFDLAGLAREATFGASKNGRMGGRTPFEVLAWGVATGDADDVETWGRWERGSRRRRFMAWSKGIREWAEMDDEQSDEEVAAEAPGGDFVLMLPRATYRRLQALGMECDVLELVERHGDASGLMGWLSLLDLAWSPPPERQAA